MHKATLYNRQYIHTHKVRQGHKQSDGKQDKQTPKEGCESQQGHLLWATIPRLPRYLSFPAEVFLCVSVRERCKYTSKSTAYYTVIKKNTEKKNTL